MRLGRLIDHLKALPQDALISYSDGLVPGALHSYRGYYDQLALDRLEDTGPAPAPLVSEVLANAKAAVGKKFEGWKGGEYVMSVNTTVWVSRMGDADSLAISAVTLSPQTFAAPHRVVIATADVRDYLGF